MTLTAFYLPTEAGNRGTMELIVIDALESGRPWLLNNTKNSILYDSIMAGRIIKRETGNTQLRPNKATANKENGQPELPMSSGDTIAGDPDVEMTNGFINGTRRANSLGNASGKCIKEPRDIVHCT